MRLLAFAASLRQASHNRRLVGLAADLARARGAEVDLAEFREFDVPLFNADVHAREGVPPGALELARRIGAADGLVIASPEYNYSVPGTLKNALDWVSRIRPVPLIGKRCLLLAASSTGGGLRGLWSLRIPLEGLGVVVHPEMFVLTWAAEAWDADGGLRDPGARERLAAVVEGFLSAR